MNKIKDIINTITIPNKTKIKLSNYKAHGKYPIIDQSNTFILGYTNDSSKLIIDVPLIIFGDHTCILKYIDFHFAPGTDGIKLIKPKTNNINTKYLFYLLKSINLKPTEYSRHYKYLINKSLHKEIPPLEVQKEIVSILEKVEQLKEKRKNTITWTDELIKSIFYDMFGDPIKNDKGWDVKKLGKVCEKITDGTHIAPTYTTNGIPMLDSKDIVNYKINDKNPSKFISKETDDQLSKRCKPKKDDLLISSRGSIGKLAIVYNNQNFNIMGNIILLRFNKQYNNPKFQLFNLNNIITIIIKKAHGGSQKGLYLKNIKKINIIIPPIELQNKFSTIVEKIKKIKEKQIKSKDEIDNLFNSLMNKYFNSD